MEFFVELKIRGQPGYIVRRPQGSGTYVFVHFLGPVLLDEAKSVRAPRGSCILITPDFPTYIAAGRAGIYNSYFHLPPELIRPVLGRYPFPLNRPLEGLKMSVVESLLRAMRVEWLSQEQRWDEGFRLVLERLFLLLYRVGGPLEPLSHPRRMKLHEVRLRAHENLKHAWTLDEMAGLAGLGRSRFAAVYAKQHLRDEELSVAEVAERSGFFDFYYFSRCFRRLVGQSPSQYRKNRTRKV
jgi:AraC-like DNA-binding protein